MPRVLITGASRGIGLGLARAHAVAGWQVTGTFRGPRPRAAEPCIRWSAADVTDPDSLGRRDGAGRPLPF